MPTLKLSPMCLTEWIRLRDYNSGRPRKVLGREIPPWVWEAYQVIGVFLFGCACQQLTTDVAKYTIGRLRPHFFDSAVDFLKADDEYDRKIKRRKLDGSVAAGSYTVVHEP
ncbi:hypothetical protein SFRURICE_019058 [Spodoptera frugiperda]|nr:hypothetical protein SFRURICE_019058 [Spodoptera frugiperda]